MNSKQALCIVGGSLLIVGVFMPFFSWPGVGVLTFFANSKRDGLIVLALAITSIGIGVSRKFAWLWLTGIASVAFVTYTSVEMQYAIANLHRMSDHAHDKKLVETLLGNFIGSLEFGPAVLLIGGVCLLTSAYMGSERDHPLVVLLRSIVTTKFGWSILLGVLPLLLAGIMMLFIYPLGACYLPTSCETSASAFVRGFSKFDVLATGISFISSAVLLVFVVIDRIRLFFRRSR